MDAATPVPGPVLTAQILLWIDIALMGVAVVVLLFTAAGEAGQTPQEATRLVMVILWSAVLVVLIAFLTVKLAARRRIALEAVHVNHGLSPNAGAWARFCRAECRRRGVRWRPR